MKQIPFTKAEGARNDFVIVDDRQRELSRAVREHLARRVCERRTGVGADGVIFIESNGRTDFTMVFFNPDGSTGSMCGNGGRCAALFAWERGIAGESQRFDVLDVEYAAEIRGGEVKLYFPQPRTIETGVHISVSGRTLPVSFIHNGAPHVVIIYPDVATGPEPLRAYDIDPLGRSIRHHPRFQPEGTNVNFIDVDDRGDVHIRTFEKGVEAETLACGTGNIASALAAHIARNLDPPVVLHTRGGDTLRVGWNRPDTDVNLDRTDTRRYADGLYLEGPARMVFNGIIDAADQERA